MLKKKPALVVWNTSLYASVFDIWAKAGIPSIGGSSFDAFRRVLARLEGAYALGVLIFVSGGEGVTAKSALLFGALFGVFAYATFDLTSLAILRHWTWPAAAVRVGSA